MSVVTATLLSEKKEIKTIYHLVSIDIRREVNRIPYASLVLLDGDTAKREFPMSDSGYFEPGAEIEVKLRYEADPASKDATLFKGPVIRHGIEASARGALLKLEMSDAAIKLTRARKSTVFAAKTTDKDAIGKVLKECEVGAGTLAKADIEHKQLIRYDSTGWDFILLRAQANGLWVVADDGKVSTIDPREAAEKTHTLAYGTKDVIYELEMEADAQQQLDAVQAVGWSVEKQEPSKPAEAKAYALAQGNLDGTKLAGAVGAASYLLSHPVPVATEELQAWADASLVRSRLSMIRGRLALPGRADIKIGDAVSIDGVGKRFNGKARVTGVCHRVDVEGWRTDIQLGLSARSFAREEGISDAPAAGLLPPVNGLQIGVVDKFEKDPDEQLRVKVNLPGIDAKTGVVWARLAAPDAGKNRGWFFRPEPGDEVVVGFFNNDPRQAVILGGLHGPKNTPPENFSELTQENKTKVLVTKTGTIFGFMDDKKGSVFIETAGGARVLLDDSAKSLELIDQNGNELKMDKDGIKIKTAKDLKIEATGNVEIKGAKVDIK